MIQEQRVTVDRIMEAADRKIWVRFQKEGIHKYPAALEEAHLADVAFLGYPHRHIFHFRVWIDVFHNDRDVEFIQFKRWCESLYNGNNSVLALDYKSCEMMADDLYVQIAAKYPERTVWIEVSEDSENGALIKYELTKPYNSIKI
jgi:hypothetical protein